MQDFHALVEAEDALKAIEKNSSGSRPRELFEDALEEVEEVYIKNQTLMRAAKLDLQAETDYADFAAAFEASTDESLGAIPEHHRSETVIPPYMWHLSPESYLYHTSLQPLWLLMATGGTLK